MTRIYADYTRIKWIKIMPIITKSGQLNPRKGFTLVELLVYISLVSMMLLAVASFAKIILQARVRNQVISEVEQQGVQVIQIISQTIRNAENITAPASGGGTGGLTLNVISVSQNPTVFSLDSDIIKIKEGSTSQINLTNSKVIASDLIFQNLSRTDTPGIIKYSFVLDYDNQSDKPEYNYLKTFYSSASLR